jgi:DNA replication protein DnaC
VADFDYTATPAGNPAVINTLASGSRGSTGEPVCLIWDSSTGKSHLLIGLGTAAAEAGHRVRYTLASKLVNELVEAADERQLPRTITRYVRVGSLCLDEFARAPRPRTDAPPLGLTHPAPLPGRDMTAPQSREPRRRCHLAR